MKNRLKKISFVNYIYRLYKYVLWKIFIWINTLRGKIIVKNPIWIDTDQIKWELKGLNNKEKMKLSNKYGIIFSGDWDQHVEDLNKYDIFQAFHQRFLLNKPWSDTLHYRRRCRKIESGAEVQGCRSIKEYDSYLEKIEDLYYKIKKFGYRTQVKMRTLKPWDEIRVAIGRDGSVIFIDGRHRLAIAKTLKLNKIPVTVCVIHPEYLRNLPNNVQTGQNANFRAFYR